MIQNGQAATASSVINHRKDRMSYVLDDTHQQYRVVPWPESPALTSEAKRTPPVTRTFDGLKCVAVPVRDSTGKIVGKN